jgi:FkbM family methyltransferase
MTRRHLPRALVHRGVPWRTRWSLLTVALRRRLAPAEWYSISYGRGRLPITHDDYAVDWETLKTIVVDGIYETEYDGAVVLDIGAHKGYLGAYALAHGARTVISFEPETRNYAYLERCARGYRERRADWQLRQAAVGEAAGEAELHVMRASWGHALSPPSEWAEYAVGSERVQVVAMADLLAEAAAQAEGGSLIVKINAEGAECAMILGTPAAAWRAVTRVLVATHEWAGCTVEQLAEHLSAAGLVRRAHDDGERMLSMARPDVGTTP